MGSKSDFWSSFDFNSNIYIEIKNKKNLNVRTSECPNGRVSSHSECPNECPNLRTAGFLHKIFLLKGV